MSFYFREKPRFGDKLRGKSRDELMQELNQQFDDSKSFFEPAPTRLTRDPFERHTGFSRGFPFDDVEGFGRRNNDIRSHLDDLASRHPEFADHLLGPAWGDIPAFHTGSLRRRRGSGSGSSSSYQGHPDEDARSQASGSSATSAASGASGVSSQGEVIFPEQRPSGDRSATGKPEASAPRRNPIPHYGLRNTVDIGQHRHDMDNTDKANRGQRSMSAPPENRQQDEIPVAHESLQQNSQNPNQRFVSRVDITPQFVPQQPERMPPKPQQQQQPQQSQKPQQQPQSNVRHIPIFVEGRDEPVTRKGPVTDYTDGAWVYTKPQPASGQFQQPPQFQSPPQFHRPSHFNQHYGRARDWVPNFVEEFYPPQAPFQQPGWCRTPSHFRQDEANRGQHRGHQEQPHFAQAQNPQQSPQQQRTSEQPPQETPVEQPRKQTQPKDPLEKVAEVQKEVDALTEQVNLWSGASRKDKQYMFLDEMLTRELIKLDDIETEGKDNVRQARKNAIRSIQDSISLLESKAPLGGAQATVAPEAANEAASGEEKPEVAVVMDETKPVEDEQAPIPLPAAPSSPVKETSPSNAEDRKGDEENRQQMALEENHFKAEEQPSLQESGEVVAENSTPAEVSAPANMDVQGLPATEDRQEPETQVEGETKQETNMEVETQPMSPKTAKKMKKTRKQTPQQQTPICDGPIPLPAPETHQKEDAK